MTHPIESLSGPGVIAVLALMASVTDSLLPSGADTLIGTFLEKGGLVALLAVLIFFYRRDWVRLNESTRDQNDRLMTVIERSNEVHQETAVAVSELTGVVKTLERRREPRG